jgi:hypothetical protein
VTGRAAPIDYAGLAAALLDRAHLLVPSWLPGGVQRGHEWVCGDLSGAEGDSCSVNLVTGKWADFSGDESGGDLTSLYAAIHGMGQADAARELMEHLGWATQAPSAAPRPAPAREDRAQAMAQALQAKPSEGTKEEADSPARRASRWRPIVPVPGFAPAPRFRWRFHDRPADVWRELDAVRTWEYAFEGQRYGYVARFERVNSKGDLVKDTLPLTWCQDTHDDRGACQWQWKTWEVPRPLYVPATLLSGDLSLPVVVVEGDDDATILEEFFLGDEAIEVRPVNVGEFAAVLLDVLAHRHTALHRVAPLHRRSHVDALLRGILQRYAVDVEEEMGEALFPFFDCRCRRDDTARHCRCHLRRQLGGVAGPVQSVASRNTEGNESFRLRPDADEGDIGAGERLGDKVLDGADGLCRRILFAVGEDVD